METFTADESRQKCVDAMGDDLGSVFYQLRLELVFLYGKWEEFLHLFGEGEEQVQLLNRHGPYFFWTVQEALIENVIIHVARLTDPARTRGDENLSVPLLIELIADKEVRSRAAELANICHEKAETARKHRNKRIAHRDLAHALKKAPEPLSAISRKEIEEMLESFSWLLGYLQKHYFDSTYLFKGIGVNGAKTLVHSLNTYERLLEVEDKRLRSTL